MFSIHRHRRALGPAPQHSRKASLEVRVEPSEVLRVRKAVVLLGGDGVDLVKVAPVPGSTRVCVFVRLRREALAKVMSAVMNFVPNGEFGRLVSA
jgi:hypothetical protein